MNSTSSPSFTAPPLDEVVLGVQFVAPEGYNTTFNGDIYSLFRDDYPMVQEHPALPPQVEAFGGNPQSGMQINFGEPPAKTRLWFLSADDSHLLQHQEDRLLFNWRNRSGAMPYPRHAKMAELYGKHLQKLEQFHIKAFGKPLSLIQAEVAYINIIPVTSLDEINKWLSLVDGRGIEFEGLNVGFGSVVYSEKRQPVARMFYEVQAVFHQQTLRPAIRLALTCRGKPSAETIAAGLEFITFARERIVRDFCKLTTSEAHKIWGRQS